MPNGIFALVMHSRGGGIRHAENCYVAGWRRHLLASRGFLKWQRFINSRAALTIFAAFACADRKTLTPFIYNLGSGMLGTGLGILVQVTAPGFHRRVEKPASAANPIRSVSMLLDRSLAEIIQLACEPRFFKASYCCSSLAGWWLCCCFAQISRTGPPTPSKTRRGPLLFALMTQLLLLPCFVDACQRQRTSTWRFSYAYFSLVLLNARFHTRFRMPALAAAAPGYVENSAVQRPTFCRVFHSDSSALCPYAVPKHSLFRRLFSAS